MESKILQVRKWGNSGGILVPQQWVGKQAEVVLIDRSGEIKREVLEILKDDLEDIYGIYLVGSYARGEQEEISDVDILAISEKTNKSISSGRYNVEIYSLESVKKTLEKNPIMIYPRLKEARTILNKNLLENLLREKIKIENVKRYLEECKRVIKINRELIEIDKELGNDLEAGVVYSLALRMRGVYLTKGILSSERYKNKEFLKWMQDGTELTAKEVREIYEVYKQVRDNKKVTGGISIKLGEQILNSLEKEVEKYDKKKKTP